MQTLKRNFFLIIFTFAAVLTFASPGHSQGVVVSVTRGPHPSWEGTAAGNVQPFMRNDDNLRTAVLTQPAPEVWLEFAESKREGQPTRKPSHEKEPVIQVLLPREGAELLKTFWEKTLLFDYREAYEKAETAQEQINRDKAWGSYRSTTEQALQKIEITAPDGVRKISDEEANRLVYFVRKVSAEVVKTAKWGANHEAGMSSPRGNGRTHNRWPQKRQQLATNEEHSGNRRHDGASYLLHHWGGVDCLLVALVWIGAAATTLGIPDSIAVRRDSGGGVSLVSYSWLNRAKRLGVRGHSRWFIGAVWTWGEFNNTSSCAAAISLSWLLARSSCDRPMVS
jgi:hypothetical protein